MNILILSVGTRNKIIQYFKKELTGKGRVIATDMSKMAPALYEADRYYIVPRMTEIGYIDKIFEICKKENIKGILSLIDPELSLLAANVAKFSKLGVTVIGSSYDICELSLNKYKMYRWLKKHNYNCARSYTSFDEFEKSGVSYPVFVKPIRGSASIAIAKADDEKKARLLFDQRDGMMVQEFLNGQEIGIDVYIDIISGEVISIFAKKKIVMRAGETDKAVSFKDEKLFMLIEKFVKEVGYKGQIDIDAFYINGEYYISEVNPRFGGGYPHAHECGCNHMNLIVNNLENKENIKNLDTYDEGVYMMKYNEVLLKKF